MTVVEIQFKGLILKFYFQTVNSLKPVPMTYLLVSWYKFTVKEFSH